MDAGAPASPFLYAQRILIQLQKRGQATALPISIDAIAEAVVAITGITSVRFRIVNGDNQFVNAIFRRYREVENGREVDVADIILNGGLNAPSLRYAACKELCQGLFSDIESSRISDAVEIDAYIAGLMDTTPFGPFSAALQTEQFASICALEILCPFALRLPFYRRIMHGASTMAEAAAIFGIPESLAAILFNPAYHENARISYEAEALAEFRLDPRSKSLSSDLHIMFQRNVKRALKENEELHLRGQD